MDNNKTITKVDDENLLITTHRKEKQLIGKETIIAKMEEKQKEMDKLSEWLKKFN